MLVHLDGVSENMDVFIKLYMDVLERPQPDAPTYPAIGFIGTHLNGSFGFLKIQ